MVKNLKEALQAYRQATTKEEKEDVLYHVYGIEVIYEINEKKERDRIFRLKFKIGAMAKAHYHITKRFYHTERRDLDQYILESVHRIFEKGKVDFDRTNREIEVWFTKKLIGLVKNELNDESKKQGLNRPQHIVYRNKEKKSDASLYDKVALQRYNDRHVKYPFDEFIKEIGDYEGILTKQQLEIFTLYNAGYTQEEVAEKLGCTQQNVQKTYNTAVNRIHDKYINYKLTQIAHKSPNMLIIIENYIHNFNNIIQFDISESFDYYGYTYKFLKDNYKFYNIHNDESYTVMDVIFDDLKSHEHVLFRNVVDSFTNDKITFTSREKDRVIKIVNGILYKHIENTYESAGNIVKDATYNNSIVEKFYKM